MPHFECGAFNHSAISPDKSAIISHHFSVRRVDNLLLLFIQPFFVFCRTLLTKNRNSVIVIYAKYKRGEICAYFCLGRCFYPSVEDYQRLIKSSLFSLTFTKKRLNKSWSERKDKKCSQSLKPVGSNTALLLTRR